MCVCVCVCEFVCVCVCVYVCVVVFVHWHCSVQLSMFTWKSAIEIKSLLRLKNKVQKITKHVNVPEVVTSLAQLSCPDNKKDNNICTVTGSLHYQSTSSSLTLTCKLTVHTFN